MAPTPKILEPGIVRRDAVASRGGQVAHPPGALQRPWNDKSRKKKRQKKKTPTQGQSEIELTIYGLAGRICTVFARGATSIREVKERIQEKCGIPVHEQVLFNHDAEELRQDAMLLMKVSLAEKTPMGSADSDTASPSAASPSTASCSTAAEDSSPSRPQGMPLKADIDLLHRPVKQAEALLELSKTRTQAQVLDVFKNAGEAQQDRTVVLEAVRRNPDCIHFAAEDIRSDSQVMTAVVQKNGMLIRFASGELVNDPKLAMVAVTNNYNAYPHLPDELRDDKAIFMAAVQKERTTRQVFRFASERLRADREAVMAALAKDGLNLAFAAPHLRADSEIAIAALKQNNMALRYVAREIRCRFDVLDAAGWKTETPGIECHVPQKTSADRWLDVLSIEPALSQTMRREVPRGTHTRRMT